MTEEVIDINKEMPSTRLLSLEISNVEDAEQALKIMMKEMATIHCSATFQN